MSDTIRQMHNANRVRNALRDYQTFLYFKGSWRPCGPLEYFVNREARKAGGSAVLCRIRQRGGRA